MNFHYLVALGACDGLHQREVDVLETIATYIGLSKAEVISVTPLRRLQETKSQVLLRRVSHMAISLLPHRDLRHLLGDRIT